jgi:hypothetical protein
MYLTAGEELVDAVTVIGEATVAFGVGVQTVTAVVLVGVQLTCALAELATIIVGSTTKTYRAKTRLKRTLALRIQLSRIAELQVGCHSGPCCSIPGRRLPKGRRISRLRASDR